MNADYFLAAFGLYIVFLIAIGWFVSRHQKSGDDFLLAGRSLPIFLTVGTTVATMVGTGSSMGAVGFGYGHGWGGALYGVGGAVGILLLGILFAPVRAQRFSTMSEELASYVGDQPLVKKVVALLIFIACLGWLGAHILGGSLYLAWIAGIDLQLAKLLVALGFAVFVVIGGYHAVVWTDTLQALVLFTGFMLMAGFALHQVGGWEAMLAAQPASHRNPLAADSIGLLPSISLAVVIAVGVLATPSFRQRIYSARSVASVRRSFFISGSLYLGFSLVPAIIGMCAYVLSPELDNRNYAFPFLAIEVLPLTIGLIVLLAGLSATMSSASSDAIAGVSILVRDFSRDFSRPPARKPAPNPAQPETGASDSIRRSRIGLVLVIGAALGLAMLSDDLIGYIGKMISTVMAGLFVCGMLGRFWPRYTWQGALASLLAGAMASILVMVTANEYWGNPILPAVFAALVAGVLVSLVTGAPRAVVESDPEFDAG
ncbi:sodium:solute symporter family protein [Microbulbifer sp. CAU 1566]|uniref:sodium:solute symporter family protein n=1 Tax=Microbulbifer sp. CAU 1566 TaxID=2933269 RepID=UPI002003817C|nr:sodium:solute symporter family protein [Microbulbifer sp. CAU 1566]MCK7596224.1 sodium:solute symporter family protein [Microbulbifer sp. CAU 1566]